MDNTNNCLQNIPDKDMCTNYQINTSVALYKIIIINYQ